MSAADTPAASPQAERDALDESVVEDGRGVRSPLFLAGLAVVLLGALVARWLAVEVPTWTDGAASWLADIGANVDYPVYAVLAGLLLNAVLHGAGLRDRLAAGFRTEFFIKTGLVVLGSTVLLSVIVDAAARSVLQGVLLISGVFAFTWWFAGRLGVDDKLRALLATAVAVCGVSAAIAAAGAVRARREQLAYAAGLVIVFALPSIFVLPALADWFGLSDAVAGAWFGGNIDTTAAVTAAGAIQGDDALQIAAIVKGTQNALIGFVAIGLTAYFAFKVDRGAEKPRAIELWHRFPKFVLGFVVASIVATLWLDQISDAARVDEIKNVTKVFSTYFFTLAFVAIGLEFKVKPLRDAGWRPVAAFGAATVFNLALALLLASVLFHGFELPST